MLFLNANSIDPGYLKGDESLIPRYIDMISV